MSVYTFPNFLFTPLAGIMADRLGRKKLLVPSLFLYGILGGACFLAPDFNTLLILRGLQGIAGAPFRSIPFAIIGDIFSGQKRAEAMGFITTVMYVGYIIYPLLGGALANLAWNYVFLPFLAAIPVGVMALIWLHSPEPENKQSLKDYIGGGIIYLKNWKVLWLFATTVITYILLYGAYLDYFSLLLGDRFDAPPLIIGAFVSIVGVIIAGSSSQLGKLSKKVRAASIIIVAFVVYAVSMAIIPVSPTLWFCLVPTIVFGLAHGLNLASQRFIAAGVAPFEHRAGFMALHGTMTPLGMTIGPLLMGLVYGLSGLNATFFVAALIALIIPIMAAIIGKDKLSAR